MERQRSKKRSREHANAAKVPKNKTSAISAILPAPQRQQPRRGVIELFSDSADEAERDERRREPGSDDDSDVEVMQEETSSSEDAVDDEAEEAGDALQHRRKRSKHTPRQDKHSDSHHRHDSHRKQRREEKRRQLQEQARLTILADTLSAKRYERSEQAKRRLRDARRLWKREKARGDEALNTQRVQKLREDRDALLAMYQHQIDLLAAYCHHLGQAQALWQETRLREGRQELTSKWLRQDRKRLQKLRSTHADLSARYSDAALTAAGAAVPVVVPVMAAVVPSQGEAVDALAQLAAYDEDDAGVALPDNVGDAQLQEEEQEEEEEQEMIVETPPKQATPPRQKKPALPSPFDAAKHLMSQVLAGRPARPSAPTTPKSRPSPYDVEKHAPSRQAAKTRRPSPFAGEPLQPRQPALPVRKEPVVEAAPRKRRVLTNVPDPR